MFNKIEEENQNFIMEYFSHQGIYGKVLSKLSSEEMFFKKMTAGDKTEEEMNWENTADMGEMIRSIKTFQYFDKNIFSCKICNFMTEARQKIERHVTLVHIQPKRRMSERDVVIDYIN